MASRSTLPARNLLALVGAAQPTAPEEVPDDRHTPSVAARRIEPLPEPSPVAAPPEEPITTQVPTAGAERRSRGTLPARQARRMTRVAVYLPVDLAEDLRNCVVQFSGPPHFLTVTNVSERVFRDGLKRLRKELNHGEPFSARARDPKPGRPIRT